MGSLQMNWIFLQFFHISLLGMCCHPSDVIIHMQLTRADIKDEQKMVQPLLLS